MTDSPRKPSSLRVETLEARDNPSRVGFPFPTFDIPSIRLASGGVFADANANGVKDAGENGVNGVRVYADWNNNGTRDAAEPSAVTSDATTARSVNGVTTVTREAGFYLFNAGGRGAPANAPLRVELPAGAALTTPPRGYPSPSTRADFGLSGVTGTPPVTLPNDGTIIFVSGSSSSSSSSGSSSSSFLSATSATLPGGGSYASVTGSVTGNGSVSGFASAGGDVAVSAVFVG